MKHLVSTALVLALLGGTSALAAPQDDHGDHGGGGRGSAAGRPAETGRAAGPARPQAQTPQAAPQAQGQRGPGWERAGRERGQGQAQTQAAPQDQRGPGWERARPNQGGAAAQQDRRGPDGGGFQDRRGNDGGGFQDRRGNDGDRRGPDGRDFQDRDRGGPNGGDFRGRPGGPGGSPGWERADRPGARSQAIRPQDRAQRDFNRQRFDPRRWGFDHRPVRRYHWRGYYQAPYGFYAHSWAFGEIMPGGWYTPNYYVDDWSDYGLQPPAYGCEWVREGDDAVMVDVYTGRVLSVVYGLFY